MSRDPSVIVCVREDVCTKMRIPCSPVWWDGHLERRAISNKGLAQSQLEKPMGLAVAWERFRLAMEAFTLICHN